MQLRSEIMQCSKEEKQHREKAEERTRETTLDEYIKANHDAYVPMNVETNMNLVSKAFATSPRDKPCPTIQPWSDFLEQQCAILGTLYDTFPADERCFESRHVIKAEGEVMPRITSEDMLSYFLYHSILYPIELITDKLKTEDGVSREFGLAHGIIFDHCPHALSDDAEEVVKKQAALSQSQNPRQWQYATHICAYRSDDGAKKRTMLFVCEYKPPHKLTASHLRAGLRPMDIFKEVVNRNTIPTVKDPEGRFRYHSERLTASALTQTYQHMIEGGLQYGMLTTGKAFVFLKVDWQDPGTLYYHLAEPGPEMADHPTDALSCAAVGQFLAFSLMASSTLDETRILSQDMRNQAIQGSRRWAEEFETVLYSIPEDERLPPAGSSYPPNTYSNILRSPYSSRREKNPQHVHGSDGQDQNPRRSDAQQSQEKGNQGGHDGQGEQCREYCTQECLLGLVNRTPLDRKCPNAALHQPETPNGCHPIDHAEFTRLLHDQLEKSLDDRVVKLDSDGSRGALFQVTLLTHGYTFISKGTIPVYIPNLKHEQDVYDQLKRLQGTVVPVCLGSIDLRSMDLTYYYEHRVYIRYMMFLSWAGVEFDKSYGEDQVMKCVHAIHEEGVVHKDIHLKNVLYDSASDRVMLVDFERSSIFKLTQSPHSQETRNRYESGCRDDICDATVMFL